MKRIIILDLLLVMLLLFLVPLFLGLTIKDLPEGNQPSLDKTAKVDSLHAVTGTFLATKNDLSIIGVSIKNPNLSNKEPLTFNLYQDNKLVRTINLSGSNIEDGSLVKISFSPITDSEGKVYRLEFLAPNTYQFPLEIFLSDQQIQDGGIVIHNLTPHSPEEYQTLPGSIALLPYYRVTNRLSNSLSLYKNIFVQMSKDLGFSIIYVLVIAALVGYVLFI